MKHAIRDMFKFELVHNLSNGFDFIEMTWASKRKGILKANRMPL